MLSPQQIAHYQAFGFVIVRQVLTPAEQQQLHAEVEQRLDAMYTHRPFDGSERHWSGPMMGDETPFMQGLTEDERFVGVAEQLYGEDVLLAGLRRQPLYRAHRLAPGASLPPWSP